MLANKDDLLPFVLFILEANLELIEKSFANAETQEELVTEYALLKMIQSYNSETDSEKCKALTQAKDTVEKLENLIQRAKKEIETREAGLLDS
tara:strand:- start:304 stop:582 length:279 start_codon:yes stop_codon:yes gene_type:complete